MKYIVWQTVDGFNTVARPISRCRGGIADGSKVETQEVEMHRIAIFLTPLPAALTKC